MKKQEKGITLVALIITIIVLLILAVVAIQEITGDGIITKAKNAAEKYQIGQIQEEAETVKDDAKIEYSISGRTLGQAEILSRLQQHFEGSIIEGNSVIVKNGKYKIVVDKNTNISVEGNTPTEHVRGDAKVTHTVTKISSGYQTNLEIELVDIPMYKSTELSYRFFEKRVLKGKSTEELIVIVGEIYTGQTLEAKQVYDAMYKAEFRNRI